MIIVDDVLVSDHILDKKFVCDLTQCKGGCCVEGDAGALALFTVTELVVAVQPFSVTVSV